MISFLRTLAFPVACAFTGAAAALLVTHMVAADAPTCPPAPIVEIHPHMLAPPAPPAPPPAPVIAFHQHTLAPPAPAAERAAFEPLPDAAVLGQAEQVVVRCANAGRCSVDRKYLFGLLEDPRRLEQQARILPSIKDGVMQGIKFYGIRPDSLPKQLGLKNGDMLVAIDDVAVTSLETLLNLKFRPEQPSYLFTFKRKGETVGLRVGLH